MSKQILIIGGGIAGLTASIYSARAGMKTTLLTGYSLGSLSETPFVENYPGFPNGISGFELVSNMLEQAKNNNIEIIEEQAVFLDSKNNSVTSDSNNVYNYDGLIVSTGSKSLKLQAKNANKYDLKGIYYCAICDGSLYKDKNVILVGGGNTSFTDALYLSDICKKVDIFIRKDYARADQHLINNVLNKNNVEVCYNSVITQFQGDNKLNKVIYTHNGIVKEKEIDAVFVAIGSQLNDDILVNAFGKNYIQKLPQNIMLAGDLNTYYHQAIIAAGNGASVVLQMIDYLRKQ